MVVPMSSVECTAAYMVRASEVFERVNPTSGHPQPENIGRLAVCI
jgi:hypothetical protein